MENTVINFKTKADLKRKAQLKAEKLGLSLTSVLNFMLKEFLKKDDIAFVTKKEKEGLRLSAWAVKQVAIADKETKAGYVSPAFNNEEDALKWLNDKDSRYINGKKV